MRLLITGAAGFIGFHLAMSRLKLGEKVYGIDNLNDYYDVNLKNARLKQLQLFPNFKFFQHDLANQSGLDEIFREFQPTQVIHLAAQAGVRYSLMHPEKYVQSNLVGFANLLEACRHHEVGHLIYASTSSVYGANTHQPYCENQGTNHPLSIYAASKKANELMAHSYSHLFNLPTTGVRFFTVYGPWGRPDMAFFTFTRKILNDEPIEVFNQGNMVRDFTYIDDIVAGLNGLLSKPASPNLHWDSQSPDPSTSMAPYQIFNIGCGTPVRLMDYIDAIEQATGKRAKKIFLPMQPGDVLSTHADTNRLHDAVGYVPKTHYQEGVRHFVTWYRDYYRT